MPLPKRNCILDEATHRYRWDPEGVNEPMRISVTGVVNYFKQINYEQATRTPPHEGRIRTARWNALPGTTCSPATTSLTSWMATGTSAQKASTAACGSRRCKAERSTPLTASRIPDGMDMGAFWADIEVIDTEYTMVSRRRSLGGQLDLLYRSSEGVTLLRCEDQVR